MTIVCSWSIFLDDIDLLIIPCWLNPTSNLHLHEKRKRARFSAHDTQIMCLLAPTLLLLLISLQSKDQRSQSVCELCQCDIHALLNIASQPLHTDVKAVVGVVVGLEHDITQVATAETCRLNFLTILYRIS